MKWLLVMLLVPSIATAGCPAAVDLHVGDTVTDCDRVGLSKEESAKVKKDLTDSDYNKQIIESQKKLIDTQALSIVNANKRSDLWQQDSQRDRDALDAEKSRTKLDFWIGVGVGILTVFLGAKVAQSVK